MCSRSDAWAHCASSSRCRRRYLGRYGAAPTTTPKPRASVNAPTSVLGSVTAPAIAEPRLGPSAGRRLLASSARSPAWDESESADAADGDGAGGSAGTTDGSGAGSEPGAGAPCGAADASEPPLEPVDGMEPEVGGKPGTSGTPGRLDPPSSWPGTWTSMSRPGTPMSMGGVVTGGRIWLYAGAAATVTTRTVAATTSAPTAARRIMSAPPRARCGPSSISPPASTRRTSSRARARFRR